ncbi:MAG: hypothetical protein MUD17_11550 [Gemmatimonadaceae bacterium]|nr:hypothetical protein [Gemmatimonadaceae bacterium]
MLADDAATIASANAPTLRRLHPTSLLFHAITFARQFVFPIVVLLLQLRKDRGPWVWWVLGGMVVLFIAAAVARYLTTRYGLSADALHVRSGVFARQQRVIP